MVLLLFSFHTIWSSTPFGNETCMMHRHHRVPIIKNGFGDLLWSIGAFSLYSYVLIHRYTVPPYISCYDSKLSYNIICLCLFHRQLCMILFVHGVMVSSPCVLSNKYPLFALPSYCCVSSFYQVFLFCNSFFFFFHSFPSHFSLIGNMFPMFTTQKIPP